MLLALMDPLLRRRRAIEAHTSFVCGIAGGVASWIDLDSIRYAPPRLRANNRQLLRAEAERTGTGLAELVRRALDRTYGTKQHHDRINALEKSFGAWSDRDANGAEYVENLRRGMERRLSSR